MLEVVVSVMVGVVTGLLAWWLITRLPIPRLEASLVCRTPRQGRALYRIKIVRRRLLPVRGQPAVDVRVLVTLRVRGLDRDRPEMWNNFNVPVVNDGRVPLLDSNTIVTLHPEWIEIGKRPRLSRALDTKNPRTLDLQEMLCLGGEAHLRLMITASDVYTHATGTKVLYRRSGDVRTGRRFRDAPGRAGLEILDEDDDEEERHAALVLIGAPGAGKSSVMEALSTLLERQGVPHGAIESEELARGYPPLRGGAWTQALAATLALQRRAGRTLFLIAATPESGEELQAVLAASDAQRTLVVCLRAPSGVLAARLERREPDRWPGKAPLIAHARELADAIPELPAVELAIDTEDRDPEEVAREVLHAMRAAELL